MNQLTTSLWGDESFTAVAVSENFSRMLQIVAKDTAPPLYYICLSVWTRIFGSSEVAIRSLSVLLFLGTVAVVYLIAKTVWNKKTGLLAALLTLANPFLFTFAFEGRMYTILVFTVTLSFYFFITNNNLGYILSATAAIYSHHYAILVLMFQFFWRLLNIGHLKKNGFKLLKPYLFIGLLYLPWLYPLYKQVTMVSGQGFWLGRPQLKDIAGLLAKYIVGDPLFKWQKYLLIVAGLILVLKQWGKQLKNNLLFLGWVLFPIVVAFLLSLGKTSIFYDRYLIFIIPGLALLLTGSLRKLSPFLIILFSLPLLWVNYYYFTHPTKRPFRELAQYVKQEASKNDLLINYNGSAHHLWESKYYGLNAPLYNPGGTLPYYVGTAQMTDKDIITNLPRLNRIGVIASEKPETINIQNYQLVTYRQFDSLYFSWFIPNEKS
jgi:uncharacterized membrane protein